MYKLYFLHFLRLLNKLKIELTVIQFTIYLVTVFGLEGTAVSSRVLQCSMRNCWVLQGIKNIYRYFWVLKGVARYYSVLLGISGHCSILWGFLRVLCVGNKRSLANLS